MFSWMPLFVLSRSAVVPVIDGIFNAGSSMLRRAKQQGPAAYARLSLCSPGKGMAAAALPNITSTAQPPGFCPAFHATQDVSVVLNQQSMRILAMQVTKTPWHGNQVNELTRHAVKDANTPT